MMKIKLLLEIIKHSTKAKIISCSVGVGVIAIGGIITYNIATNNNTASENKNSSEIVTTYNEKENEEVKDKEDPKDESKPVVNEEVKKEDTTTSTPTSSSDEKPSTTTSDTKTNGGTTTEPQTTEPQVETPPTEPKVETPPSYKAAGIDWELTEQANQLRESIYGNGYLGDKASEVNEVAKNVCLYNSAIPQWLIDGFDDTYLGKLKYVETKKGQYTITSANDLRTGIVHAYSNSMDTTEHRVKASREYIKVENDGQGNIIVTCINLVIGTNF